MQRFKLVCDNSCDLDTHVVTHEFTAEQLSDVLMNLDMFLKGVGYMYDGQLFIDDDLPVTNITVTGYQPNEHYFDTERNR